MAAKDSRSDNDAAVSMKHIERFLKFLTWQLFFLIVLMAYMLIGPRPGRYQLVPPLPVPEDGGKVLIFDTATRWVDVISLQEKIEAAGSPAGTTPAAPPQTGQ